MNQEKFLKIAKKRLVYDFDTIKNAADHFELISNNLSAALTGNRKMPKPVLDYLGYEMNRPPVYEKIKN